MTSMHRRRAYLLLAVISAGALVVACDTDDTAVETQRFRVTIENVGGAQDLLESGAFTTPIGQAEPGPLFPGDAYEITVHAAPGHRLSFATMMVHSNDLFYAPGAEGIALYDAQGMPVSGDVTDRVHLWDAGTEVNQEPGSGEDQAPRQTAADTGAMDPDPTVRMAMDEHGNLPAVEEVLAVTVTHAGGDTFTVRIENVSDADTLMHAGGSSAVPLAPGAWAVHSGDNPLFVSGMAAGGSGLEALAEDGDPGALSMTLADRTGLTSPFAPGVWRVDASGDGLFTSGQADRGEGLEALAEDGDPSGLAGRLPAGSSGVFDTPDGAGGPGPLLPGSAYSFELEARPGDRLYFATMLVLSNDLFVAPAGDGLALFDAQGVAVTGDVTAQLALWDAGTEVNQRPGTGSDQPLHQAGPDSGAAEMGVVRPVDDGFSYPAVDRLVRVTITTVP